MNSDLRQIQISVCKSFKTEVCEAYPGDKFGISQYALDGLFPLNGLRHPSSTGVTGWYFWGGTELSDSDGFFKPLHVGHLEERCELCLKFLLLPPGWRFLTDGNYEDVWFDANLLLVDNTRLNES